jgi:hypothetical protein
MNDPDLVAGVAPAAHCVPEHATAPPHDRRRLDVPLSERPYAIVAPGELARSVHLR